MPKLRFLRVIEQSLQWHCPGAAKLDNALVHIDEAALAQVQAEVRTRILRAFAGRGLIERFEAAQMLAYHHRYYGVLAPNWPLRAAVTAMAQPAPVQTAGGQTGTGDNPSDIAPARGPPLWDDRVMCRAQTQTVSGRGPRSNRTGVNRPRQRPTTRSISALIGERANRRCTRAANNPIQL